MARKEPAVAPSEPLPLHAYNKLDGLRVLEHALKGVKGSRVLPYRVYREPSEFALTDFDLPASPGSRVVIAPSRLLVRTNLEGDVSDRYWHQLPRDDATLMDAVRTMNHMRRDWEELGVRPVDEPPRPPMHFIVHPVEHRSHYRIYGNVTYGSFRARKGFSISLQFPRLEDFVWRNVREHGAADVPQNAIMIPNSFAARRHVPLVHDHLKGLLGERDAKTVLDNLQRAMRRIHTHAARTAGKKEHLQYEASFSIKEGETDLEFFDLIKTKKS